MIFYLHIPKTGGQTLATRLSSAFPPTRVNIMREEFIFPDGKQTLEQFAQTMDFVEGHVTGPVLRELDALQLLVTIRNPVDQIVSAYGHILREPLNNLHRAAKDLPYDAFFDAFADNFRNFQSQCLIFSLFAKSWEEEMNRSKSELIANLIPAIKRLEWLVPTEAIDEFTVLWEVQTRRIISEPSIKLNIGQPIATDSSIRDYLKSRPGLYDIDLVLWNLAREWFSQYREKVLRHDKEFAVENATCAFVSGDCGIWLTRGWHPPIVRTDGVAEWWAGPTRISEVRIRRKRQNASLGFEIVCLLGFRVEDIAFTKADGQKVSTHVEAVAPDCIRITVELAHFEYEDRLLIQVPRILSGFETSKTDRNTTKRSFATQNWKLTDQSASSHLEDDRTSDSENVVIALQNAKTNARPGVAAVAREDGLPPSA